MIPVIIPSYNKPEQLAKCVVHLEAQTVDVEVFIRDNSIDNVYFTAAINEGLTRYLEEDCRYILILNQHVCLQPDAVKEMVSFMDSHPQCGIGTPLQLHSENPDYVVCAGCLGLQKGDASTQAQRLGGAMSLENLGDELSDFADTAAAISNLDLIISVDTAVLHLAGAMGKEAWGLLPFDADWRWMRERDDSPWYPTMKLFRQSRPRDWDGVFDCVAAELKKCVGSPGIRVNV